MKALASSSSVSAPRTRGCSALYGGVIPGCIVLVSVAVQIVLATRGGK